MDRTEHLSENELALYVDGLRLHRLERVPGKLVDHVQSCLECKGAIMEISAAIPETVYSESETHPFFGTKARRGHWQQRTPLFVRVAAGFVVLLGMGTLIFYVSSQKEGGNLQAGNVQVKEPGPTPSGDAKNAAGSPSLAAMESFKPSVLYDRLAGETFRSTANVKHHPANGDTISIHEIFSWDGMKPAALYTLSILDNRGRELAQARLARSNYRLERALAPGLYYWKVEEEGDLVFVGKFFVVR